MNKEVKELIDNYIQGSKVYSNGEIKDKETMVKAINELAEYYNKKFHFETALIKLNRIKDGDTTYKFDEIEATELLNYINQLETNRDEAIKLIKFEWEEILKNEKYSNHLWSVDGLVIKEIISSLERGKE